MAYYEGSINDLGCNGNNGGMGDWSWIVALALVGGLFGNGNFGFGGGNRGGFGYGCGTPATVQDVASGFSTSEIMSDLNAIINSLTQGFAGLNASVSNATSTLGYNMLQGFNGVDNAVCTLSFNTQAGFNQLATQVAQCCCDTRQAIADVKYANERQTADIVQAINAGNQRLVDIYTADKMDAYRTEIATLRGQISDERQADRIISKLSPCPTPAYVVPNPNCCYNYGVYPTGGCGATIQ